MGGRAGQVLLWAWGVGEGGAPRAAVGAAGGAGARHPHFGEDGGGPGNATACAYTAGLPSTLRHWRGGGGQPAAAPLVPPLCDAWCGRHRCVVAMDCPALHVMNVDHPADGGYTYTGME